MRTCLSFAAVSLWQKVTQTGRKEDIFDASPKPQYYYLLLHSSMVDQIKTFSKNVGVCCFRGRLDPLSASLFAVQTALGGESAAEGKEEEELVLFDMSASKATDELVSDFFSEFFVQ